MERKLNLLFGLMAGLVLILLNVLLELSSSSILESLRSYGMDNLLGILSFIGIICSVYFSILLIIDVMNTIHKK